MRTPGGSRTSAIARGREGATAGASAENGRKALLVRSVFVALIVCDDRIILSLALQPRPSTVVIGRRAWSLLRRLIARAPEVFMKDAKENRYLLHSVLREIQELLAVTRPIYRRLSLSPGQLKFSRSGQRQVR